MKDYFRAFFRAALVAAGIVAYVFALAVILVGCGGGDPSGHVETKPLEVAQ